MNRDLKIILVGVVVALCVVAVFHLLQLPAHRDLLDPPQVYVPNPQEWGVHKLGGTTKLMTVKQWNKTHPLGSTTTEMIMPEYHERRFDEKGQETSNVLEFHK